jgi:TolB-like protein/Tfp pilus assembly protein PilF
VETEETLNFCRVDGATLINDSSAFSSEAGTVQLGSACAANETETNILAHTTNAAVARGTGATTVLAARPLPTATSRLTKSQRRTVVVALAALITVAFVVAGYSYYSGINKSVIHSIAVMPFVNESHNADLEYLSDGMAETLISTLSQLPNLNVKARSTVFRYKGKETDAQTIGKELNVQTVLNGRVMQRGDQLTLSLELVNVQTENVIWSDQYNRKQADLVSLQSEIARDVLSKLRKLSGTDEARVTKNYTGDPEAYQLYLKGRFYFDKRTEDGMKKAIEYFGQAIAKDPIYALAYSGLADAYTLTGAQNATLGGSPSKEMFPKARAAAMKAVEADDTLAEAHVSLAHVTLYYRDWSRAEKEYQRALELNPNYGTAHHWYGLGLMLNGRFDEALAEVKRAQELEPVSLPVNTSLGWVLWARREYNMGAEQLQKTLEMNPNFLLAHYRLAKIYVNNKMYEEAIAKFQQSARLSGNGPLAIAGLGQAYALSGDRSKALETIAQLQKLSSEVFISPYHTALIYAGMGDKDQAFAWLEKAFAEGDGSLILLKIDPGLDNLRSDTRYANLVHRAWVSE